MRRWQKMLTAAILGCCLSGTQGWAAPAEEKLAGPPEKKAAADQESDKEVVIRGESRLKVKFEKPEPDLKFDVDEIAVPYVKTEDYVMDVSPTSIANSAISVASYLNSSQTASPYIQIFKKTPILTLRPRYKSKGSISHWRLRITDGFGNVFKDFSGKGSLPAEIVWEGRNKNLEMMDVGTSYSYIFSVVDEATNPTSQMGRPIILESLLYEQNGTTIGKVTVEALFSKNMRKNSLSPKGELYCREIADIFTARQTYPVILECYAKDVDTANTLGEIIQAYLSEHYTLPKDKFKIESYKSRLEKIAFKLR